jgi:hypothetical protein
MKSLQRALRTAFHNSSDVSQEGSFSRMGEGQDEGDEMARRSPPSFMSRRSMATWELVAFGIIKSPSP